MAKIKFIADTACDIPDQELARLSIDMPSVPITVDGEGYFERKSFTIPQFYDLLAASSEIPATSRVPASDYLDCYTRAWEEGHTDIISVTINAKGSGTYESSRIAIDQFFEAHPEAKGQVSIHLVDSKTYSMGYGHPVIKAAEMARDGGDVPEILDYLHDFFDRLEIYLACYTLDYAKKSGRISAAAAFVGDMLGLRPIIYLIDGQTKIVEKIRGEKQVTAKLVDIYRNRVEDSREDCFVVSAAVDAYGDALVAEMKKELGRDISQYKAGASIVINAGPNIAAICLLGKKRS